MEQLRIIPILMLFVGILFVYSGFQNQSPSEILRGVLGKGPDAQLYGANVSPVNNTGVLAYHAPVKTLNVGTF